jgi:hypothetical protein
LYDHCKVKEGNDHEYYNAHHHQRVDPIVRRGRQLLLEETTVGVASHITLTQKQNLIKKEGDESMKKLVVLFVAITFLATFTLIGCNQSAPTPEQGATGAAGAPGATGAPGAPGAAGAPGAPAPAPAK